MKAHTDRAFHPTGALTLAFAATLFLLLAAPLRAAEEDPAATARKALEAVTVISQTATNTEAELRHTQQSIEKLRRDLELRVMQHSESITANLRLIELSLRGMHDRQMEAVKTSNQTIITVASVFAAVGLIGLIVILFILARALGRFSEIAVAMGPRTPLISAGQPGNGALLANGDVSAPRNGAAEESSARFQGAIDQLQKRILELEQSVQTTPAGPATGKERGATFAALAKSATTTTTNIEPLMPEDTPETAGEGATPSSRASVLLGKGQALLNLDSVEPAMQCFNEALALDPNNAEALVKRGMAFEKMQDWERALECYDNAIAADAGLTVAYLYRGGVCNRLQRYREALESYEQALRTEKSSRAS